MPLIRIDGVEYEVEAGKNLLQTCLELGLDLPYFCWHPAMGSVGACRQCAVIQYMNEEDERGRVVMGCMTPVTDGAIFSLAGDKAAEFREMVVESLMLNHPHDCPVCAEGGECHLQDMTVMVGHRDRRYRGRKNTHRNQYLGPLIHHEMNRCITCYRCTRYYRDYAGGTDLAAMAAHDHVYFGRHEEGVLESPFAGNLVEVCPTGVFTDRSLVQEYTRKWDLQSAPSVCVNCAVGCNTLPGERYGKLKRIHNRYNREVNGYFLCDRGRYGGSFVNSERRLDQAGIREADGRFRAVTPDEALAACGLACRGKQMAGIGSPRASLESNYLLQQLVGSENYSTGVDDSEQAALDRILSHLGSCGVHNPSLQEIESADAILVLGEDVTHTAPRMALALRQSVRNRAFEMAADLKLEVWQDAAIRNLAQDRLSPLHIIGSGSTGLDDVASSVISTDLAGQDKFASDLARSLVEQREPWGDLCEIWADLRAAKRPLVICGTSNASEALLDSAVAIARALHRPERPAMLSFCLAECNSLGVTLLNHRQGTSLEQLAQRAEQGRLDTLIVMENDLFRRMPADRLQALRAGVETLIGIDTLDSLTLSECDLVLPAAAFTECEGTLVSAEGRAQRFFPTHPAAHERRGSWQWLHSISSTCERPDMAGLGHIDAIIAAMAVSSSLLAGVARAAPDHHYRSRGLKVPRQTHRYSGRTAMRADVSVHEPRQSTDAESALAFTMEGSATTDRPGSLLSYVWSPGCNSNQSLHKFQDEVGGSLKGGTAGTRLLDGLNLQPPAPAMIRGASTDSTNDYELLPRPRVFGSEELSSACERIEQMAGRAFLEINSESARQLSVTAGDGLLLCQEAFEVRINDSIPRGCAGFPVGFEETRQLRPGQRVPLSADPDWQRHHPEIIGSDQGGAL